MKVCIVLLILFSVFLFSVQSSKPLEKPKLSKLIKDSGLVEDLNTAQRTWRRMQAATTKMNIGDLSVDCALCGIALNEIEGFLSENVSQSEIETFLEKDICNNLSGELKSACDSIVNQLPNVISLLEHRWDVSVACIDLKLCQKPFAPHKDLDSVPHYTVDLDQPPIQRWKSICSHPDYQKTTQFLVNTVDSLLPNGGKVIEEIGTWLNELYLPNEYAQEIVGCANSLGVSVGWATLLNLGYEVSDACTSIVAQTDDGKILHSRNLDFWAGMGFTDSLKNITFEAEFQQNGKSVFTVTSFAGFVGVLSGIRPGAFSLTIDTRFYPGGLGELFYEIIAALEEKNATLVALLSRDVIEKENDFQSALENLSNDELIADVYYILAGIKPGEGAVISRNRHNATNVWLLDSPTRWFEVETNYDHWEPPPWFDDRRDPANRAMNAVTQKDVTLDNMLKVMSTKPVLNLQTTYTILSCPQTGEYTTYQRWCPFPCTQ